MTRQEIKQAFLADGVQSRIESIESCAKLDDGSYGPIVTRYVVVATIRDDRHGNTVRREIVEGEAVDVAAVVREMRAELASRAKETRAASRSWRSVGRS
jgi:hypothetical protein